MSATSQRPAQPSYVFRGHAKPVHALLFLRDNLRLLSGDADGFVVLWSLITKRPTATWRAHKSAILGLAAWGNDKIITHGREDSLCVWRVGPEHESQGILSVQLPVEDPSVERLAPWILHRLPISTLTFCSFASYPISPNFSNAAAATPMSTGRPKNDDNCVIVDEKESLSARLLIAVCGTRDTEIEVYLMPDERRIALIPEPNQTVGKTGMVMALEIEYNDDKRVLVVAAAYESGRVCVFHQEPGQTGWSEFFTSQVHSQPILGLAINFQAQCIFTSSADSIIARHPLTLRKIEESLQKDVNTHHAGQQGLKVRSDGKILATAGWDARFRVYSTKTLKELAVLKWHKEGCFAVAFAGIKDLPSSKDPANQVVSNNFRTIAQSREAKVKATHWLAGGSKDGKVSLWDIY